MSHGSFAEEARRKPEICVLYDTVSAGVSGLLVLSCADKNVPHTGHIPPVQACLAPDILVYCWPVIPDV